MVGGLVEEQDLRVGGKGRGDGQPLAPPARQLTHRLLGSLEAELVEGDGDPDPAFGLVLGLRRAALRASGRHLDDRGSRVEVVVLLDRGHPQPATAVDSALVGALFTREDPQQGGLAGAVGTDDPHVITLGNTQAQPVEQGSRPE